MGEHINISCGWVLPRELIASISCVISLKNKRLDICLFGNVLFPN